MQTSSLILRLVRLIFCLTEAHSFIWQVDTRVMWLFSSTDGCTPTPSHRAGFQLQKNSMI